MFMRICFPLSKCCCRNGGAALGAALLLGACATSAKKDGSAFVYFPPPPDEPRLQFLRSFSSGKGLGGSGTFTEFLVGKETGNFPIAKPYGLAAAPGKLFICDTEMGALEVVDLNRNRLAYFKPRGESYLGLPMNVAVDADGTRYVTDTKREQVLIYDAKGNYLASLGQRDEMKPVGVAVFQNRLYVTDIKNHLVRVYNKATRQLTFTVPRSAEAEKGRLFQPTNIAIDAGGRMIVSDTGGFSIQIYDPEGKHLQTVGEMGLTPGKFALPKGVAVDREGRFYVVDAKTQYVQLFDAEGKVLMYLGDPKSEGPGSTSLPAGVTVDYANVKYFEKYAAPGFKVEYLVYVVNQFGPHKISVFGFGKKS